MLKIHYFNYLIKLKVIINESVVYISDFSNWSTFDNNNINKLKKIATELNCETSIILFRNKPLNEGLFNMDNIIKISKNLNIDNLIIYDYNDNYLSFNKLDLFNNMNNELLFKKVLIPENYYINKVFNTKTFKEFYNDNCIIIDDFNEKKLDSDAYISIVNNDFATFQKITGCFYKIDGVVQKGKQLGRTIGFPTINIIIKNKLIINYGIYACSVFIHHLNKTFIGAGCYWKNELNQEVFEVHILNFDMEIYDWTVTIQLLEWLRNNVKVNSLDELKQLLEKDVNYCKNKFNKEIYE
ncbi:riboflavin kinase [Spiroplasma turonicum]|uniref:riboflavin kinase n=1 Tax=Spiroplasma turonicum TaxID=216946 RepID=A0A0K1P641_9MOLU|nr:riboflavin kinase [Spiroplasma turonicum]AKU79735.1 riboflavin kinase/FAD synthetase [Spiroplasma turonicum]ALX70753.1 riboflavin kinase/FAD synthetase [Spiroplasma turonicum]